MSDQPRRPSWPQKLLAMLVLLWEMFVPRAKAPLVSADPTATLLIQESGRAGDRNEDLEHGVNLHRRQKWGTFIVLIALALACMAGVAFVWVYWARPDNNLLLGGALAGFFGSIGAGLVLHAHSMMIHKEATELREPLPSSPEERQHTYEEFTEAKLQVQRRNLLILLATTGVLGCAGAVVSLFRSLGTPPGLELYDKVWKRGQRLVTLDGKPMLEDSLGVGDTVVVFPEDKVGDEHAQTVLVRVDESLLRLPRERSNWAPKGYLAYSRVCTHAGCPVGLWEKNVCELLCPCHQSTFDVLRAAAPTGGPAERALPQLPLYMESDGSLRAGGAFTEPPGPGFWGLPS